MLFVQVRSKEPRYKYYQLVVHLNPGLDPFMPRSDLHPDLPYTMRSFIKYTDLDVAYHYQVLAPAESGISLILVPLMKQISSQICLLLA